MKAQHLGSDFNDFLTQERLLPEVETVAAKRMITYQLSTLMREERSHHTAPTRQVGQTGAVYSWSGSFGVELYPAAREIGGNNASQSEGD